MLSEAGKVGEEEGNDKGGREMGRVDSARVDEGGGRVVGDKTDGVKREGKEIEGQGLERSGEDGEVEDKRRGARQRTFSMEMNEAIEALHREEEDVDECMVSLHSLHNTDIY